MVNTPVCNMRGAAPKRVKPMSQTVLLKPIPRMPVSYFERAEQNNNARVVLHNRELQHQLDTLKKEFLTYKQACQDLTAQVQRLQKALDDKQTECELVLMNNKLYEEQWFRHRHAIFQNE